MKADVMIIGGGAIGAAVAYYLKLESAGCDVVVVEEDATYAQTSTPRASGGVRRLFSLPENIALSNYSIPFFEDFPTTMAVDGQAAEIGFKKNGYNDFGVTRGACDCLRRDCRGLQPDGKTPSPHPGEKRRGLERDLSSSVRAMEREFADAALQR